MPFALLADNPPPEIPFFLNPMFLIGMMALFWILVILPANRKMKREQAAMLAGIKRGARVVTTSGIYGVVVSVKETEDEMVIRSEDSRLKVRKSTVAAVLGSDEADAGK